MLILIANKMSNLYFVHSIEPISHSFKRIRVSPSRNLIGINTSHAVVVDFISIGIMMETSMSNIMNNIIIVMKFVENTDFFGPWAIKPHSNLVFSNIFVLLFSFMREKIINKPALIMVAKFIVFSVIFGLLLF